MTGRGLSERLLDKNDVIDRILERVVHVCIEVGAAHLPSFVIIFLRTFQNSFKQNNSHQKILNSLN